MELFATVDQGGCILDMSHLNLESLNLDTVGHERRRVTQQLYLYNNRLTVFPASVCLFSNLEVLDISNNGLTVLCEDIQRLSNLKTLIAKNNRLNEFSFPKEFGSMQIDTLNFSGNIFEEVPIQFLKLQRLKYLSLGGNRLKAIPSEIEHVTRLYSLRCLSLHNNLLTYLPREILSLVHLQELSLRGNPLVVRFIKDMTYDPPSLLELAGRAIKSCNLPYHTNYLPGNLVHYLDLASKCPNPKCTGVYFDSCVRHIKFVDFCGKYRLPFMHYLCSPECTSPCSSNPQSDAESEDEKCVSANRLQRVLLG
ncbi:leucine-rich repeat-containing protein 58-like isoform X2 [Oncorhynchus keta]|uniref:leucine-rich repeat-containing protein 58-like isoform X2 n=1 Tax=Oncorhynchus keta TaxID=8018 RepID=UPI0015FC7CA8|nr:leucine-rich repeat-containing protein 58-like isoform X2 [Oncorhynchus keta]